MRLGLLGLILIIHILFVAYFILNEVRLFNSVPAPLWEYKLENQQKYPISKSDIFLYGDELIVTDLNKLYALSLNSGKLLWNYDIDSGSC